MSVAVIVTTYNRPDALAAVLAGYAEQTFPDFELLVADDGSTDDTRRLIEDFQRSRPVKLQHVWQEDRGFRAGAARNRAVAHTQADYLIFVDGDCVPAPGFVAQHRALAQQGFFLAGNRILLSEAFTQRVLSECLPIQRWHSSRWFAAWLKRDVNRLLPLVTLPDTDFRLRAPRRWEGVKTCNLSLWRSDFVHVNGFDESYAGWGLEDSDLAIRLIHAGIRHKSARFATPVFHLWHRENDRSRLPENQKLLEAIITSDRVQARLGLDQYA